VENIGDIDLDGLSDIAVSAPYVGQGVVYIYRGSDSGVVTDDFQVSISMQCQVRKKDYRLYMPQLDKVTSLLDKK